MTLIAYSHQVQFDKTNKISYLHKNKSAKILISIVFSNSVSTLYTGSVARQNTIEPNMLSILDAARCEMTNPDSKLISRSIYDVLT